MSAAVMAVQAGIVAALRASPGVMASVSGIYDGPPPRAAFPYVALGDAVASDWGTKTEEGREVRFPLIVWDDGEEPARLHALMAEVERAVPMMAREPEGWRIASIAFLRSMVVRDASGPWAGLIEFRVRILARD